MTADSAYKYRRPLSVFAREQPHHILDVAWRAHEAQRNPVSARKHGNRVVLEDEMLHYPPVKGLKIPKQVNPQSFNQKLFCNG